MIVGVGPSFWRTRKGYGTMASRRSSYFVPFFRSLDDDEDKMKMVIDMTNIIFIKSTAS